MVSASWLDIICGAACNSVVFKATAIRNLSGDCFGIVYTDLANDTRINAIGDCHEREV